MENICEGCGLCCDGTLYSHVDIRNGDSIAFLENAGLRVVIGADPVKPNFRQPCTASVGGRCAIYPDRPIACREYRCKLLRRYDEGGVTAEEARAHIQTATTLRDQLRLQMEPLAGGALAMPLGLLSKLVLARLERSVDGPRPPQYAGMLLDIGTLSVFLSRHFRVSAAPSASDGTTGEAAMTDPGATA